MRAHLKMSCTSCRLAETYVKAGEEWEYLYRAIDSTGQTLQPMLSAKRDVSPAKRFFKKLMRADHRRLPFTAGTGKRASYPEAFAAPVEEKALPSDRKPRRVKYPDNVIGQDRRATGRGRRAARCFRSSRTAGRTPEGVEAPHVMRKGRAKRSGGRDAAGQAGFAECLPGVAA